MKKGSNTPSGQAKAWRGVSTCLRPSRHRALILHCIGCRKITKICQQMIKIRENGHPWWFWGLLGEILEAFAPKAQKSDLAYPPPEPPLSPLSGSPNWHLDGKVVHKGLLRWPAGCKRLPVTVFLKWCSRQGESSVLTLPGGPFSAKSCRRRSKKAHRGSSAHLGRCPFRIVF